MKEVFYYGFDTYSTFKVVVNLIVHIDTKPNPYFPIVDCEWGINLIF